MPRVNTLNCLIFSIFFVFTILVGCSSNEKNADTPEGAYAIAQEYEKEEQYESAIKRYMEVKNKFPYSKYSIMSELAVADVYYKQESYPEAQIAYQSFKDLHPKHPQIDYVTYRLGMSFFKQLPETIDRDLSLAQSAILYLDEVVTNYPKSENAADAQEKKSSVLKMLAEKEQYIADFYFKRGKFESALRRYESLYKKYPRMGFDAHALSRASLCANKLGDKDKAKKIFNELKQAFPESNEAQDTEKELAR